MLPLPLPSYPDILYTDKGKQAIENLWEEILNEFESVNSRAILASL